jgi:hypothetical protein
MKKPNYYRILLLQKKREKKRLKRLRKPKTYLGFGSVFNKEQRFRISIDKKVVLAFKSPLYNYLLDNDFITGSELSKLVIKIPKEFSLSVNYDRTIETIKNIVYSLWKNVGKEIELDFTNCKTVDQPALFLLQILRLELSNDLVELDKRLSILSAKTKVKITQATEPSVNLDLFLCGYLPEVSVKKGLQPIDTLGYIKGSKSQKHYFENRKGIIGTNIVSYIDKCLMYNSYSLTADGKGTLGNMIGEILNNAEDHSPLNTYYVTANYYVDKGDSNDNKENVGVLNLSFMNFGYSIYEGLEQTKNENSDVYSFLDGVYSELGRVPFSKENLFTLYALQDGVSRLKFQDLSRGTGTMTFINCFYSIGDYENVDRELSPQLSILSGSTQLLCNNRYRPFQSNDGSFSLSLNSENDLTKPPDKRNVLSLKYKFPGTILSVRFCLNEAHIQKKLESNGNN